MRRRSLAIAALLLLAAACGDPAETVADQLTEAPAPGTPAPVTSAPDSPAVVAPDDGSVEADCEAPATEITAGSPIEGVVDQAEPDQGRQFFCIQVPAGVVNLGFALSGLGDNLDIFVGYPDMETVQGGGVDFWWSDSSGTDDEMVLIEPGRIRDDLGNFIEADFVRSGPYYMEVSGGSSAFTLDVTFG